MKQRRKSMNEKILFHDQFQQMFKQSVFPEDDAWYHLGIKIVINTESVSEKEDVLNKMLIIYPHNHNLYYYMGCIYKDTDPYKAISWYRICFQLNPNHIENILDYVKVLFDLDMIDYIVKWNQDNNNILHYIQDFRAQFMLGTIYIKAAKLEKALSTYHFLMDNIHSVPNTHTVFVYLNYAYLLGKIGYIKEAFLNYNNLILPWLQKNGHEEILQSKDAQVAVKSLYENYILLHDYIYHNMNERYELCRYVNSKMQMQMKMSPYKHAIPSCILNKEIPSSITLGYVSSDFQDHAVSNFIVPILKRHSRFFNIHLFSQKVLNIMQVQSWNPNITVHHIQYMSDEDCAKCIFDCKIDILFDLNGYTHGNRLGIFVYKPAPIQVNYLGYPNSLSLDFIQYRITDNLADNSLSKQIYTETRIYLPKCFLLFESILQNGPLKPRDPNVVLDTPIVFGALNKELKNSEAALHAWSCILNKVPDSKIIIKIDSIDMMDSRKEYYSRALGIDPSRIEIVCKCSENEYVNLYSRIDILLDTFPYSGTTTTCNALYNSVPVITLYNKDYHCNNVSSSLLFHSDLHAFIAYTPEQYIEKAVQLSTLRITDIDLIHQRFMKLMDPEVFMENYEKTILKLYKVHWENIRKQAQSAPNEK